MIDTTILLVKEDEANTREIERERMRRRRRRNSRQQRCVRATDKIKRQYNNNLIIIYFKLSESI
jgi:hypothetical protein